MKLIAQNINGSTATHCHQGKGKPHCRRYSSEFVEHGLGYTTHTCDIGMALGADGERAPACILMERYAKRKVLE